MPSPATLKEYIGIAPASSLELAELVERGLPAANLDLLKSQGLSFMEMATTVIFPRTLKHRKARGENLSPTETERALRVASIIRLADTVFGDRETAMLWLRGSDDRLGNRTPMSMLQTEPGGRLVEQMLWGIHEGVYS